MRILVIFAFLIAGCASVPNVVADYKNECVILMHGLGDIKLSMRKLEKSLVSRGYETMNIGYTTAGETIESIADNKLSGIVAECHEEGFEKIHFVTHSMGALIVRYYLQDKELPTGSRIVMLSPPNKGTAIADYFSESPFYKLLVGYVGQELTTDSPIINNLKDIDLDIGIIAGNKSINPLFSSIIPGEDDGRISVENMKLDNMTDFLTVPCTHLLIKHNPEVIEQTAYFLEHGKFNKLKNIKVYNRKNNQ